MGKLGGDSQGGWKPDESRPEKVPASPPVPAPPALGQAAEPRETPKPENGAGQRLRGDTESPAEPEVSPGPVASKPEVDQDEPATALEGLCDIALEFPGDHTTTVDVCRMCAEFASPRHMRTFGCH